ncbi:MAG: phosphoglucosamine mutase [Actinomycetota bacterium]|jgi:phosphoglucosamine mutase|nr:phosphoglucosamine mutase [Actinomycetota bacterium]
MTLRFGTDGVRGVANRELTPELLLALGRAAGRVLAGPGSSFLVGRDTRLSGPMVQAALTAGLTAEGVEVIDLGVLPTPGVAWLSAADDRPGAVISASHNPYTDNGVKFFAAGGRKLDDPAEARLEAELDGIVRSGASAPSAAEDAPVGRVRTAPEEGRQYADALVASLPEAALSGLTVVLDCAHGAAYEVAPAVYRRLGATVHVIHDRPDGCNINAGAGSTHPAALQAEVVARQADVGLAFDGDADRVLAVDAGGELVDGDQLIAVCALDRKQRGRLPDDTVVVTVMANLGFRQAMAAAGVKLVETDVGDRYVLEALEKGGWSLGGEQSGHVIFRDQATTGDGTRTGLQLLDVMVRTGRPLAELASVVVRRPQVLRNVVVAEPARFGRDGPVEGDDGLAAAVAAVRDELGDGGRVLIRASGTEPVIRVMVEAASAVEAESATETLCRAVTEALGAG